MSKEKPIKKEKMDSSTLLVAHQIKSGLTAIKWSLKMMSNGDFGKINEEQKNILEKTIDKNETLISFINNVLHGPAAKEHNKSLVNIEDIIEFVIDYYTQQADGKKIKVEFKKPGENLPKVMLDEEMIKIAIQNIFENALKYTPLNGKIAVFLTCDEKNIEIQIQDSGIGIPENQKDKIFSKFFRGNNAMEMNSEGSGVGLFIVKNIIEANNGKIWFESKENKGTSFYISLPINTY